MTGEASACRRLLAVASRRTTKNDRPSYGDVSAFHGGRGQTAHAGNITRNGWRV